MKNKIIAMLCALSLIGTGMVGCGDSNSTNKSDNGTKETTSSDVEPNEEGDNNSENTAGGEKTTIRWALWDLEGQPYWRPLAETYMENNPNVEIEYVDLGSADYNVMLATQLAGSSDLDVITNKEIPPYGNMIKQGHFEPLNNYIEENGINKNDFNGTIEQITYEEEVYALPFRNDFWLTFYNKDLFDEASVEYPTNEMSFDDYQELAIKMTSKEGSEKVYGNYFHTWWSTVILFGRQDSKNDIFSGDYSFLKPYYESVLAAQDDGTCMDYATLKTSGTHYSGVFYNEQIAMQHMGSWFISMQMEKVKTGESLAKNWGIVRLPHANGVEPGISPSSLTTLSVNSKSNHKEVALDFINFVSGSEGAKLLAELGVFPARMSDEVIDLITSLDGFPEDDASKEALITESTFLEMPMHDKGAEILTILSEGHDDIMTGNSTVDEGLTKMGEQTKDLIDN